MQDQKRYQDAMDVLLQMIPDQLVAVSLSARRTPTMPLLNALSAP
jgi:hypothetical protein